MLRNAIIAALLIAAMSGKTKGEAATQVASPKDVVTAAWNAAATGKGDAFVACFEEPTKEQQETLQAMAAAATAGNELIKAYGEQYNAALDEKLAFMLVNGFNPAVLKGAEEAIDGDKASVSLNSGGMVRVPLVKVGGGWKISRVLTDKLNPSAVKQSLELARTVKEVTAEIKAGKLATAEDATARLRAAMMPKEKPQP